MFKKVIAPIQAWLLSQGRCVGCGLPLDKAKQEKHEKGFKVTCQCGRIFIQALDGRKYRRALFEEV